MARSSNFTSVKILPCSGGMNNVYDPEHVVFQPNARKDNPAPQFMKEVIDLDIDSSGYMSTRLGNTLVRELTTGKRLFSKGGQLFSQDGDSLYLENTVTGEATLLVEGLGGSLLAHEWPTGGDRVFFTDGTNSFSVKSGTLQPWGLDIPDVVVSKISGSLFPGSYIVTATTRTGDASDAAAQESGTSTVMRYALADASGISITATTEDPFATHVAFYVSATDQEEPFRVGVVPLSGGEATLDITTYDQLHSSFVPCITQNTNPPPPGICAVGSVQAFMLVARGNTLYRSLPGRPGLFSLNNEFQVFPSDITTIVGLQDGAWVGTKKGLYWLGGSEPAAWSRELKDPSYVLPEGTKLTGSAIPSLQSESMVALFATTRGLILGASGGQVQHLTQDKYHFASGDRVSMTVHSRGQLRQLLIATTSV